MSKLTESDKQTLLEKINNPTYFNQMADQIFQDMDINENGVIEFQELYQGLYNLALQLGTDLPTANDIREMMEKYDKNYNGVLEKAEFTPIVRKILTDIIENS